MLHPCLFDLQIMKTDRQVDITERRCERDDLKAEL